MHMKVPGRYFSSSSTGFLGHTPRSFYGSSGLSILQQWTETESIGIKRTLLFFFGWETGRVETSGAKQAMPKDKSPIHMKSVWYSCRIQTKSAKICVGKGCGKTSQLGGGSESEIQQWGSQSKGFASLSRASRLVSLCLPIQPALPAASKLVPAGHVLWHYNFCFILYRSSLHLDSPQNALQMLFILTLPSTLLTTNFNNIFTNPN